MARVDDYQAAKEIAVQKLSNRSFAEILQMTGFEAFDDTCFQIPFLDRIYRVSFPACEFKNQTEQSKEVPVQEQVLILHYMIPAHIPSPSGKWIACRSMNRATDSL